MDLQLARKDLNTLLSGKDLTEAIINAAQMLLHHQFPRVKGLQDTGLSRYLSFSKTKRNAVQIFHVELRKLSIVTILSGSAIMIKDNHAPHSSRVFSVKTGWSLGIQQNRCMVSAIFCARPLLCSPQYTLVTKI